MRESLTIEHHDNMTPEAMRYFKEGLKIAIERSGLTQTEFAKGVTSKTNLSNILNGRVGTSRHMREKLSRKAGMDPEEVVAIGKGEDSRDLVTLPHSAAEIVDHRTERRDPMTSLTQLMSTFRQQESDIIFWQACLQGIPIPICIVDKDNTVIFQNQADRSLYKMNIVGEHLCPACRENCEIPHPCEDCAIAKVQEVGEPAEKFFSMKDHDYRIIASPINTPRGAFVVIMVIEEPRRI